MSMLSEPRRRQKWSLNPRGNLWSKDDSKFGKKLLEKMGWAEGKGLGATNQGIIDPITLKSKDDNKGIGFKGSDDVWLDHQNDFDAVLQSLNDSSQDQTSTSLTSLEETSKNTRKRVHYRKFTRGKDLSQYSENDLSCILGTHKKGIRKALKEDLEDTNPSAVNSSSVNSDVEEENEAHFQAFKDGSEFDEELTKPKRKKEKNSEEETAESAPKDIESAGAEKDPLKSSFLTLNRGSMNAYFEQKMEAMRLRLAGKSAAPVSNINSVEVVKVEPDEPVKKIKKEKKIKSEETENKIKRKDKNVLQDSKDSKIEDSSKSEEMSKRKKKSKKEQEGLGEVCKAETENSKMEETEEKRSKKKKCKKETEGLEELSKGTEVYQVEDAFDTTEKSRKKKKSKKEIEGFKEPANNTSEDSKMEETLKTEDKKSKKKKMKTEMEELVDTSEDCKIEDVSETTEKIRKKKRKNEGSEESSQGTEGLQNDEASQAEEKSSKKKKSKQVIIQEEGTKEETIPEATEVKKKKKRKINDDFVEKVDDTDEQNVKKIKLESKVEDRGPVESERSDSSSTGRKRKNKNSSFTDLEAKIGFKGATLLKIAGYGNEPI